MTSKLSSMWRRPEGLAAIVNAILVVLIPFGVVFVVSLGVESGNAVHASGLQHALMNLYDIAAYVVAIVPVALLAGWRTWVHTSRYREGKGTGWRGVVEAGGLGLTLALLVLARGIVTRPTHSPPYVIFYGGVALILGLAMGLLLRATALTVLKLRAWSEPST
jgi:hypothetical protein